VVVVGQNNVAPGDTVNVTKSYKTLNAAGVPYEGPDTEGYGTPESGPSNPSPDEPSTR